MTWYINFCSGGIGSYITGKRVAERHGTDRLIHLFTDTRSEDTDLYRFLRESVELTGGELVHLSDGRTLWQVFRDHRMIGNTRTDICSKALKREVSRKWIQKNYRPDECVLYFGIDHSERHRFYGDPDYVPPREETRLEWKYKRRGGDFFLKTVTIPGKGKPGIRRRWLPYRVEAPLCEPPYMTKCEMLKECERDGLDPPRIYDEGFPHNNCNGLCVKGGHAQFLHLLKHRPAVFEENAAEEQAFREWIGKDVAILRDRRGGTTKPLPMYEFKRQVESGELTVDPRDWGKGCQCFTPDEEAAGEDG